MAKPTILILESNNTERIQLCNNIITKFPQYQVLSGRNLEEIFEAIRSQSPDIVLVGPKMLQKKWNKFLVKKIKYAAQNVLIFVVANHENEVYQIENPVEITGYILKSGLISFLARILSHIVVDSPPSGRDNVSNQIQKTWDV